MFVLLIFLFIMFIKWHCVLNLQLFVLFCLTSVLLQVALYILGIIGRIESILGGVNEN